ncbi:MAG: hypothetical protein Q4A16_08325 [Lautropia sp.]|nr:hypothetical protein [Lautropia sp.]
MPKKKKNDYPQYTAYGQPPLAGTSYGDDNDWNQTIPSPWGDPGNAYYYGYGMPPGGYPGAAHPGAPAGYPGTFSGYPPAGNFGTPPPHGAGILGWLGNRQMEQFILGLLLGGAAAYVLGDPEKRAKLIRMGMKLYSGVAGSFEEFKEQIADLKAEVAAERGIDPDA